MPDKKQQSGLRLFLAPLIAPSIAPIVAWAMDLGSGSAFPNYWEYYLVLGFPISYVLSFILGGPVVALLLKMNRYSLFYLSVGGALTSFVLTASVGLLYGANTLFATFVYIYTLVMSVVLVFWSIAGWNNSLQGREEIKSCSI